MTQSNKPNSSDTVRPSTKATFFIDQYLEMKRLNALLASGEKVANAREKLEKPAITIPLALRVSE